jgi:hypothetical protein
MKKRIPSAKGRKPDDKPGVRRGRITRDKSAATIKVSAAVRHTLEALRGLTMREWLSRPDLFGPYVADDSWFGWFVLLIAFVGEPLINDRELAKFKALTGLDYRTGIPLDELWVAASRRVGKTSAISILLTFFALTRDYSARLRPGERPLCVCIAKGVAEATELLSYVKGYFDEIALFHGLIEGETATSLRLVNRVQVQVKAGSFRSIRGHSIIFAALDEICFWNDQGSNPADEVLSAIRPSLLNLGGKLVAISSPYGKFGPMYAAYKKYADGHDPKNDFCKSKHVCSQSLDHTRDVRPRKRARPAEIRA